MFAPITDGSPSSDVAVVALAYDDTLACSGTVIAPHADAKLFVTATPQVRANRRWKQLSGQGEAVTEDQVLDDIRRRDARDSGRSAAPLTRAADADLLDTSEMTIDHAFREARRLVEQALGRSA